MTNKYPKRILDNRGILGVEDSPPPPPPPPLELDPSWSSSKFGMDTAAVVVVEEEEEEG